MLLVYNKAGGREKKRIQLKFINNIQFYNLKKTKRKQFRNKCNRHTENHKYILIAKQMLLKYIDTKHIYVLQDVFPRIIVNYLLKL